MTADHMYQGLYGDHRRGHGGQSFPVQHVTASGIPFSGPHVYAGGMLVPSMVPYGMPPPPPEFYTPSQEFRSQPGPSKRHFSESRPHSTSQQAHGHQRAYPDQQQPSSRGHLRQEYQQQQGTGQHVHSGHRDISLGRMGGYQETTSVSQHLDPSPYMPDPHHRDSCSRSRQDQDASAYQPQEPSAYYESQLSHQSRPQHNLHTTPAPPAAPPAPAPPSTSPTGSTQGPMYTTLSANIRKLVASMSPTRAELASKEEMVDRVKEAVHKAYPEFRGQVSVEPFGSYMCGLGTKHSDIDLVLVGIAEPDPALGFYSTDQRPWVAKLLDRLKNHLRNSLRITTGRLFIIRSARMPIIRLTTNDNTAIDISIAGMAGPEAAMYIKQQVLKFRSLRPLVLVLKAFLKGVELNDVSSGGLSSYGLTYMALAHLLEEAKIGSATDDLGYMLHRFFKRYGHNFDPSTMAVSVKHGGLVPKAVLSTAFGDKNERIAVIDPLTGRNCTEGTYRSEEVLTSFDKADRYLNAMYKRFEQDCPQNADVLSALVVKPPDDEGDGDEYEAPEGAFGKRKRSQELLQK